MNFSSFYAGFLALILGCGNGVSGRGSQAISPITIRPEVTGKDCTLNIQLNEIRGNLVTLVQGTVAETSAPATLRLELTSEHVVDIFGEALLVPYGQLEGKIKLEGWITTQMPIQGSMIFSGIDQGATLQFEGGFVCQP